MPLPLPNFTGSSSAAADSYAGGGTITFGNSAVPANSIWLGVGIGGVVLIATLFLLTRKR